MEVQLERWRNVVDLVTEPLVDNADALDLPLSGFKQWLKLSQQLQRALPQSPLGFGTKVGKQSAHQKGVPTQRELAQEIACLLMFVGELFYSYTVVDRLWSLLSMTHGIPQSRSTPPSTAE